jgi:hypothetical protein
MRRSSNGRPVSETAPLYEAITLTPGAVMSGCNKPRNWVTVLVRTQIRRAGKLVCANLEDLRSYGVRPSGREVRHHWRRFDAKIASVAVM